MKPRRLKNEYAVPVSVAALLDEFKYPQVDQYVPPGVPGGGGGMAHVLIVSDSEPAAVQDKADHVVPSVNSSTVLQEVFDAISADMGNGTWSIWMAGIFDLDADVTAPGGAWLRGLGWTVASCGG